VFDLLNVPETIKTELPRRVYLGELAMQDRSSKRVFYLNNVESEFERWDLKLLDENGKPSINLTYGIKNFIISMNLLKTRGSGLWVARCTDMKRKVVEEGNQINLTITIEKFTLEDYVAIEEFNFVTVYPKGQALHHLWEMVADSALEQLLDVKNETDSPFFSGRLQ